MVTKTLKCPNTWLGTDPADTTKKIEKMCGADLTEAKSVHGEELLRCPQCGRKLPDGF